MKEKTVPTSFIKSEETTKLIMDSALDATICMDRSGVIILWSKQAEKIFGWKEEETKGRLLIETIVPERYRQAHEKGFRNFFERVKGEPLHKAMEIEALNREGKEFPIELTILSLKQNGENFFCAFLRDISERKKVEDKLRKSELRYRSLFEQASDPIMITDQEGNFLDANSSFIKLFGYSIDELLQMNVKTLIDPEQLKVQPMHFERLSRGEHVFSERRMISRDSTIIEVEANVRMLPDGRLLAIARDITERKRSEAILKESEFRFRKVTENEILGVAWASPEGMVLNANNSFCKMLGYTNEELKSLHFSEFTHPLDTEKELSLIGDIFNGKTDNYTIEKRYKTKGGEFIWVELNLSCYRNPVNQSIEFFIGIVQNINERKIAEQKLRTSEQKYKLLFNKNPLPMWMISDADLSIIDVNEAAIAYYGYSKEEFLSMSAKDLRPKEDVGEFLAETLKTYNGVKNFGVWRHLKKDGTIIKVEIIGHIITYQGHPTRLILANDVTQKMIAEEKLKESHEQLRKLSSHLENIREEERTNIAREIHDELGQQLTGLKMDASWLNKKIPAENKNVREKIAGMISLIDETVKVVRRISSELRPGILDDLGLIEALDWQSNEFEKRTAIRCRFNTGLKEIRFDKSLSTGIFRVYQETLTNIARHAHASEIKTTLGQSNGNFILSVSDNGKGFNETEIKNKNTLGLVGMKERATMLGGNLTIESSEGNGTSIILEVPLKLNPENGQ